MVSNETAQCHTAQRSIYLGLRLTVLVHLVWIGRPVVEVIGEVVGRERSERSVDHRGSYTIEPCPLIGLPGSCERCARELLTVQAIWTHLGVVLSQKQQNSDRCAMSIIFLRCTGQVTWPFGRAPGKASVEISLPKPG